MGPASHHVQNRSHSKRVLLLAAACNPFKGSDFAVGWHRVLETAKYFDIWVICGAWDREDIHRWLRDRGEIPRVHFIFVEETWLERLLKSRRPYFYTNFLTYHLWQRRAFRLARRLHGQLKFALTHQVSLVGYREPGYLWKLDVPFVWGPVGGTQNYPWRFLIQAGFEGALMEGLRTIINWCQFRLSPRVRLAAQKAACVVAANTEIQHSFRKIHRVNAQVLLDIGVEKIAHREDFTCIPHNPLRLLWSGNFKHHKALPLLLQALPLLPPEVSYELKILGAGPLEARWQELARHLGVADRCQWLGWLPHERAMKMYEWADVFVFTSLRETTGTVVLEALSQGVPVICLDHQGARYVVNGTCGIKIPVTTPGGVIRGLRDALVEMAADPEKTRALSRGALARAQDFLWSRNGQEMAQKYDLLLCAKNKQETPAAVPSKNPDISVVVVTYNRAAMLRQALETLIKQKSGGAFSFEILVIDDGSSDDTASVVRAMATRAEPLPVRYVHKEGGGEGDARNRGVAEAQGHWIAFCDDDQLADPHWLANLHAATRQQGALCVGGSVSLVAPDAGRLKLGPRARRFLGEKRPSAGLGSAEAKYFMGAGNLLVHRAVFDAVGGFDPALRQGVDTDFFWRVEQGGFAFGAAPDALVYHVIPASRRQPDYLRRLCLRKGVATHRLQWKYAGAVQTIRAMFVRLGIALAVDLPLLASAALARDESLALDSRCRLWYKIGFIRAGLRALAPGVFPQERFFQELELGYHGAHRQPAANKHYSADSISE